MNKAIGVLEEIDQVNSLFKVINPTYAKERTKELKKDYAELIASLVKHFCKVTGFNIIPVNAEMVVAALSDQKVMEVM